MVPYLAFEADSALADPWGVDDVLKAASTRSRRTRPAHDKGLAYDALASLFTYLSLCKSSPSDLAIRQKLQVASWMSIWPLKMDAYSALGLSHSLGHRLGAKYGIPHGITSCLTLAPVVALQASIAIPELKKSLSRALFYLKIESTVDGKLDRILGRNTQCSHRTRCWRTRLLA
ncbi:hypothetical protein ACEPAH_6353 [Sanghuangporus vaninii]